MPQNLRRCITKREGRRVNNTFSKQVPSTLDEKKKKTPDKYMVTKSSKM